MSLDDPGPRRTVAWLVCDPLPAVALGPKPEVTVGRSTTCDMVLPHSSVSRVHAVVRVVDGGGVVVEDRSSHGCFVNGERLLGPRGLGAQDRLTIGPFTLTVAPVVTDAAVQHAAEITRPLVVPVDPLGAGTAMAGRFDKVSPVELLQGFEFHRKTARLRIEAPGEDGVLVIVDGRPTRARLGALTDLEAAVKIAALTSGRFVMQEPAADELTPSFRASITEVLLEAFRRKDEAGRNQSG